MLENSKYDLNNLMTRSKFLKKTIRARDLIDYCFSQKNNKHTRYTYF